MEVKGKRKVFPVTGPVVAQRVGRDITLLFHDRGTRRGWVVSSTPWSYFTPGKDPVPIVQEAGWALGPVWTGGKSRPTGIRTPDRPARSQSLYRLSYPAHIQMKLEICGRYQSGYSLSPSRFERGIFRMQVRSSTTWVCLLCYVFQPQLVILKFPTCGIFSVRDIPY